MPQSRSTPGFVSFVGSGPGDPELLTLKAVARLQAADAILYDDLSAGPILDHAGPAADLVAVGVLAPLNAKLGAPCFAPGASAGDEVCVRFDARCNDPAVLARLETNPPAGLYGAPAVRQKAIIRDPETLKKLSA